VSDDERLANAPVPLTMRTCSLIISSYRQTLRASPTRLTRSRAELGVTRGLARKGFFSGVSPIIRVRSNFIEISTDWNLKPLPRSGPPAWPLR